MLPDAASTLASEVDTLFNFVNVLSVLIFVGVIGAMFYFIVRYRHRRGTPHTPNPLKENIYVETGWILVPLILSMVIFTWGFKLYLKLNVVPANAYEVQVVAKQWLWEFTYPDGTKSTSELHVPVDTPVKLLMSSQDVLHSFFVPAFRIKFDVLPDRYTSVWFEATKEGEFSLQCTEYCGLQHSGMLGTVVVHSQRGFNEWLESSVDYSTLPPAEYGEILYNEQNCNACHTLDGTGAIAPSFQGLFGKTEQIDDGSSVLVDENYLRESIIDPGAQIVAGYQNAMPGIYGSLSAEQLDALIAFIKSVE